MRAESRLNPGLKPLTSCTAQSQSVSSHANACGKRQSARLTMTTTRTRLRPSLVGAGIIQITGAATGNHTPNTQLPIGSVRSNAMLGAPLLCTRPQLQTVTRHHKPCPYWASSSSLQSPQLRWQDSRNGLSRSAWRLEPVRRRVIAKRGLHRQQMMTLVVWCCRC